jgi:hypothetical protein
MRVYSGSFIALVLLSASGCGVKFTDRVINQPLSLDMLGRNIVVDTEIMKRHLEEIPGYIVVDDGTGKLDPVAPILDTFTPPVTPITDEKAFFHGIIDSNWGGGGSYLTLVSGGLDVKRKAEVTITETAEAYIPKGNVPWQKIVQWATQHPPSSQGQKRYYVQGALLSTISRTVYTEVSANATVAGGAAFGAEGKVYATDKTTETTNFAYIGVHLLDVDKIKDNPPDPTLLTERRNPYIVQGKSFKMPKPPAPKPK